MKTKYLILAVLGIISFIAENTSAQCTISSNAFMNNICNGNNVTLTVSCNPANVCPAWNWYANGSCSGAPLTGSNATSITVTPGGTTTYSVSDNCGGGCVNPITIKVSTSLPAGGITPSTLPVYACPGTTVSPAWTMDPKTVWIRYWDNAHLGLTFNGTLATAGNNWEVIVPATGSGQIITIGLSVVPDGSGNWPFTFRAENACGTWNYSSRTIHSKLPTPQMSGPTCLGCVTTATYSYNSSSCVCGTSCGTSCLDVNNEQIQYNWTWPTFMSPTGGANSYSETFNVTHPSSSSNCGTVTITQSLQGCPASSQSPTKVFNVCDKPVLLPIVGNAYACPNDNCVLTLPPPTCGGTFSYTWTAIPPIVSLTPNGNQVTVNTGTFNQAVTIKCVVNNGCAFQNKNFVLTPYTITTPGPISGPQWGQCEQTGTSYFIQPIQGVNAYQWSLSPGGIAAINGPSNLSGITLDMNTGQPQYPASLQLSVSATYLRCNGGGTCQSLPQTLTVHGDPDLATYPVSISGNQSPCLGNYEFYTAAFNGVGISTYNWVFPPGWSMISPQGNINAIAIVGGTGGNVYVTPSSNCWIGPPTLLPVNVSCRLAGHDVNNTDKFKILISSSDKSKIILNVLSEINMKAKLELHDMTGKSILETPFEIEKGGMQKDIRLNDISEGIYLLKIYNDDFLFTEKVLLLN